MHHQPSSSSTTPNQAGYQPTPFGHPYGYPGYPTQDHQASTSTATGTAEAAATAADGTEDLDTDAAYKAAQDILSAINFSDLYETAAEDAPAAKAQGEAGAGGGDGVEELLSHVQAMLASAQAGGGGAAQAVLPPLPLPAAPSDDGADPRAELQAQLALLAAQLAEVAKIEEVADAARQQQENQHPSQLPLELMSFPGPLPAPMAVLGPPPPLTAPEPVPEPLPIHPQMPVAPASATLVPPLSEPDTKPMPKEEEGESDDDDMEEVI